MSRYPSNEYVVLIEDSTADVSLFCEVMFLQNISLRLEIFSRGEEALGFLADPGVSPPQIIIIDVGLPDISGIELLQQLKQLPHMQAVQIFVWSSGATERDQASCERFLATYLDKPSDLSGWEDSLAFMLQ